MSSSSVSSPSLPYSNDELRSISDLLLELKPTPPQEDMGECVIYDLFQPWTGIVQDIGQQYLLLTKRENPVPTSASEQDRVKLHQELKVFNSQTQDAQQTIQSLIKTLEGLSDDAEALYGFTLLKHDMSPDELKQQLLDITNSLGVLRSAATDAKKYAERERGRHPNKELDHAVFSLAQIFHQATGRNPTRGLNHYDPDFQSPFERFLFACLRPIYNETTLDSIRGLIRKLP